MICFCSVCIKASQHMDHQGQFSVSHILGQCVDVTNYSSFQHQLHSYGNITVAPTAHTLHTQDASTIAPHITSATNIVTVGYATHAVQSYPGVINNNTNPHIPPPTQVQYFSYETPGVSVRPHTFHTYHSHPSPLLPLTQSQIKCTSSRQAMNNSIPSSTIQTISRGIKEPNKLRGGRVIKEKIKIKKKQPKEETTSAKLLRKRCRNHGEAYVNVVGRLVEAKKYIDIDCQCKNNCLSKLGTTADREDIFKKFWALGDFEKQNLYLAEKVVLVPNMVVRKKAPIPDERNLRTVTRQYFVRLSSNDEIRVCKTMFLSLHGVSNGRLDRVLQAVNCSFPGALQDRRGHHRPSNKTAREDVDFALQHILTFRQRREEEPLSSSHSNVHQYLMPSLTSDLQHPPQLKVSVTLPHQQSLATPSLFSDQEQQPLAIPSLASDQEQPPPSPNTLTEASGPKEMSVKKIYELYKGVCEQEGKSPVSLWVYRQIEKTKARSQTGSSVIILSSATPDITKDISGVLSDPKINTTEDCVHHMGLGGIQESQIVSENGTQTLLKEDKHRIECVKMSKKEKKAMRNSGKEYVTASGKTKKKKIYVDQECGCRYRCIPYLGNEESRKQVFERFWCMADFTRQNEYIAQKVSMVPIVSREEEGVRGSRFTDKLARTHTRIYNVQIKAGEEPVRVCKMAFLQLHGLSNGRVDRVLQAVASQSPFALKDRRGQHPPKNKTPEEDLNHALCHLVTLLGGCMEEATLPGSFKVEKMYRLYYQLCCTERRKPIGNFVYRKMLKERFNKQMSFPVSPSPDENVKTSVCQDLASVPASVGMARS